MTAARVHGVATPAAAAYVARVPIVRAIDWSPAGDALRIVDQRRLPHAWVERDLRTVDEVCEAIHTLAVRGAPAIGAAGAMGLAVAMTPRAGEPRDAWWARLDESASRIRRARPTAVNLAWAVDRVVAAVRGADAANGPHAPGALAAVLRDAASAILAEDRAMCRAIGEHGARVAAATARACSRTATPARWRRAASGPRWRRSTSPRARTARRGLRRRDAPAAAGRAADRVGARREAGVPVTVIADGMAAPLLRAGAVDAVIVGADRIAANGDVANKIGTYGLALAARAHGIPFYVAAPSSTIDPRHAERRRDPDRGARRRRGARGRGSPSRPLTSRSGTPRST